MKREGNRFKGHELRRILLYDGLIVFKHLHENIFKSFLLLHCAIYILSCAHLREFWAVADHIIQDFVSHARRVFGRHFIVYNLHSLLHIVAECEIFGCLQDFAAFKYENYLGIIKRLLRTGWMPLQQVFNRDKERNGHLTKQKEPVDENVVVLSEEHVRAGGELVNGRQYQKLKFGKITLALNSADRVFMTKESDIVVLSNIVDTENGVLLIGRKFTRKEDAYQYPINSSLLGIFRVSTLGQTRHVWNFGSLTQKCYLMPDGDSYVSVPLTHFYQQ